MCRNRSENHQIDKDYFVSFYWLIWAMGHTCVRGIFWIWILLNIHCACYLLNLKSMLYWNDIRTFWLTMMYAFRRNRSSRISHLPSYVGPFLLWFTYIVITSLVIWLPVLILSFSTGEVVTLPYVLMLLDRNNSRGPCLIRSLSLGQYNRIVLKWPLNNILGVCPQT